MLQRSLLAPQAGLGPTLSYLYIHEERSRFSPQYPTDCATDLPHQLVGLGVSSMAPVLLYSYGICMAMIDKERDSTRPFYMIKRPARSLCFSLE